MNGIKYILVLLALSLAFPAMAREEDDVWEEAEAELIEYNGEDEEALPVAKPTAEIVQETVEVEEGDTQTVEENTEVTEEVSTPDNAPEADFGNAEQVREFSGEDLPWLQSAPPVPDTGDSTESEATPAIATEESTSPPASENIQGTDTGNIPVNGETDNAEIRDIEAQNAAAEELNEIRENAENGDSASTEEKNEEEEGSTGGDKPADKAENIKEPRPVKTPVKRDEKVILGITFAEGQMDIPPTFREELDKVIEDMKKDNSMRMGLKSYVLPRAGQKTDARRISLKRAIGVRKYIISNGIDSGRIIVQALGSAFPEGNKATKDRIDITKF